MKKVVVSFMVLALCLSFTALAQAKEAPAANASKMYIAVAGDIIAPPTTRVSGVSATADDMVGGGMNLMFNYKVWTYVGVGGDVDVFGFKPPKGGKSTVELALMPTVKGFYNFAPQGIAELEVYGRMGFGYARIINQTKGAKDFNAFALKFMVGVSYDVTKSGLFVLSEMGVNHRTYKNVVTCAQDAFTFGVGVGYRF